MYTSRKGTVALIKSNITDDNKVKQMSGTDEQNTEKQALLEDLRHRNEELKCRCKEEVKEHATAVDMKLAALVTLEQKRRTATADNAKMVMETACSPVVKKEKQIVSLACQTVMQL